MAREKNVRRLFDYLPTGDIAEDGWVFYRTKDGVIGEYVENQRPDEEGPNYKLKGPWLGYRIDVDVVDDPSTEWYANDGGLRAVEQTMDREPGSLARDLGSKDAMKRASAYIDLVAYHGIREFDQYPFEIATLADLRRRYPKVR